VKEAEKWRRERRVRERKCRFFLASMDGESDESGRQSKSGF
jgi:hypothetical protein